MIYIQIPDKEDAQAFVILAKSGFPVVCLADNTYRIRDEHLKLLKRDGIAFKKLAPSKIPIPKPALVT